MIPWKLVFGGAILLLAAYIAFRWLTRKDALDSASVFLKSRNRLPHRDFHDDY